MSKPVDAHFLFKRVSLSLLNSLSLSPSVYLFLTSIKRQLCASSVSSPSAKMSTTGADSRRLFQSAQTRPFVVSSRVCPFLLPVFSPSHSDQTISLSFRWDVKSNHRQLKQEENSIPLPEESFPELFHSSRRRSSKPSKRDENPINSRKKILLFASPLFLSIHLFISSSLHHSTPFMILNHGLMQENGTCEGIRSVGRHAPRTGNV